jgi:tRNA (mo5U34)-methyltransferase
MARHTGSGVPRGSDERAEAVERLGPWFHNLHLPGGLQTAPEHPLGDFPRRKWDLVSRCVPSDLTGWRVLDIGCNAGFYSFELAERGADVLGIDVDPIYLAQAAWAVEQLRPANPPRFQRLSVYRVRELGGPFDLVWFMGVAYHLRHPLLALDLIRSITGGYLMFQMMSFPDGEPAPVPEDVHLTERGRLAAPGWPKLAFVERRLADDPTNWWVSNSACAHAMVRSSGFEVVDTPERETLWCRAVAVAGAVREELGAVLRHRG